MDISIEDFIDKYQDIYPSKNDQINPYPGKTLEETLFRKKEFYDERLPKVESLPTNRGDSMKHQRIITRFLSPAAIYNKLFLFHYMGTGKGCSMVHAIENIKQTSNLYKGAMIFAKGSGILRNLMNEIAFVCTDGRYIPENYDKLTIREKTGRLKKSLSDFYSFNTFETFAKRLSSFSDEYIINNYSNRIIVMDEIHNIRQKRGKKKSKLNAYKEFHRFLHLIKNSKIILLTGTPMKDIPAEISSMLNLLIDKQLPTGKAFEEEFLTENGLYTVVKPEKIEEFKEYFRGTVSFLSFMESDVRKEFVGNHYGNMEHFNVFTDTMSDFQASAYLEALKKDFASGEKTGVYSESRQAILFVFPDGSWGSKGFAKYVKKTKSMVGKKGKFSYRLTPQFRKTLTTGGDDKEVILENLKKFSSKYHSTIENILKNPHKNTFVYNFFVDGGGCILFSLILRLFGFRKADGNETTPGLRYGIFTNQTTATAKMLRISNTFNKPENSTGDLIQVIIGSNVVAEGYSFKNVLQEYIQTPRWNYSDVSQAIARGYRLGSHEDLDSPVLQIYQQVSLIPKNLIPPGESNITKSIDVIMYSVSEVKDVSIQNMTRILMEGAVDCALFYNRNRVNGKDGMRECQYQTCEYKCDNIDQKLITDGIPDKELDILTYNNHYISDNVKSIIEIVKEIYRNHFSLNYNSLIALINNEIVYTEFEILTSLSECITNNLPVYNRFGFICFLREDSNNYYIVSDLLVNMDYRTVYYTRYPSLGLDISYKDALDSAIWNNIPTYISEISKTINKSRFAVLMNRLPKKIQEIYIKSAITSKLSGKTLKLTDLTINLYKTYIHNIDDTWYVTFDDDYSCLTNNIWGICTEEEKLVLLTNITKEEKRLASNPYKYYAIIDNVENKFCIRNLRIEDSRRKADGTVDARLKTGRDCGNWNYDVLGEIITDIKLDYTPSGLAKAGVLTYLKKTRSAKNISKKIKKESADLETLDRLLYWSLEGKDRICEGLKLWFIERDLVAYDSCK